MRTWNWQKIVLDLKKQDWTCCSVPAKTRSTLEKIEKMLRFTNFLLILWKTLKLENENEIHFLPKIWWYPGPARGPNFRGGQVQNCGVARDPKWTILIGLQLKFRIFSKYWVEIVIYSQKICPSRESIVMASASPFSAFLLFFGRWEGTVK